MKKILALAVLMSAVVFGAQAQRSTSTYPHWTISKEIQKQQFRNVIYTPSVLTTSSDARVASKGIVAVQNRGTAVRTGRVSTGGTPSFVISKGVARKQYEKRND
jgi:hypothetical protein